MAFKYPLTSKSAIIDCPVHMVSVALGEDGRIVGSCIMCVQEARRARRRWSQRRRRARRFA